MKASSRRRSDAWQGAGEGAADPFSPPEKDVANILPDWAAGQKEDVAAADDILRRGGEEENLLLAVCVRYVASVAGLFRRDHEGAAPGFAAAYAKSSPDKRHAALIEYFNKNIDSLVENHFVKKTTANITKLLLREHVDNEVLGKTPSPEAGDTSPFRMEDKAAIVQTAAELLSRVYSAEDVREALESLAANDAAREITARATTTRRPVAAATTKRKRGPRVKSNPALPGRAPEFYEFRARRPELGGRKENIIQFIERVYKPWRGIFTRAHLRRLDEKADIAVENWISYHGKEHVPKGLVPTEDEVNTELLNASDVKPDPEALRLAKVLDTRLRRTRAPTS
jgi:hypothetical protein